MPDYAPISFQIVDEKGAKLFDLSVPFAMEIHVKQVMERAFVLTQTAALSDPFLYTVEFYGYSKMAGFPGYLGYEVESICGKSNNAQIYWALSVDGVDSPTGADTTLPGPGSSVIWRYAPVPANPQALPARTQAIQARRAARASGS